MVKYEKKSVPLREDNMVIILSPSTSKSQEILKINETFLPLWVTLCLTMQTLKILETLLT